MIKWISFQKCRVGVHLEISVIYYINNNNNKKSHMFTSVGIKKAFDRIQYLFLIKAFSKLGIGGSALNLIKRHL